MKVDHLVIGMGQVGTALLSVLGTEAYGRDLDETSIITGAKVLHICIPWSEAFPREVGQYQTRYAAGLVVVHSTVPVGTCDPHGWVHSPVRGRHDRLEASLRTFVKFFGGAQAGEAAEIFLALGVPVTTVELAATTEAGKIWELVQFGLQIKVEQAITEWCQLEGLDADTVYEGFAASYNRGYIALGEEQYVRPIIQHIPGLIGGHCIREGAALLDHLLARLVHVQDEQL